MYHASLCKETYKIGAWFRPMRAPKSAKGAALTTAGVRNRLAPHSVLRKLLKSAQAAECGAKSKRNFRVGRSRGESVVRKFLKRMDKMRSHPLAILFFLASVGTLSAQVCNNTSFTITTTSLPNPTIGVPYSQQILSSGAQAAPAWSLSVGSLPPGLNLDPMTAIISGTPTALGSYPFQVEGEYNTSATTCATQNYTMVVAAACVPTFSPASPLPPGDIGAVYPQIKFTSSCPGTYTYSEQPVDQFSPDLPPGLTLSAQGVLKGTPTGVGTFSFLLSATDQHGQLFQPQYDITFNPAPTISTPSPLPNGFVGAPYNQQITATGGVPPYVFSMDAQPPGIVNINSQGVLFGTPTTAGTYNFNIGVMDSLRAATTLPFKVTFVTATSQVQATPLSLTFNGTVSGNPPPTQAISVVPATGATLPANFRVTVDNGQSNTAAPAWITVTPISAAAPAGLVVSVDQGSMAAGAYAARIQILDSNGLVTNIPVTLNVASVAQQVTVAPSILNFSALAATPGNLVGELAVSSIGTSALGFTASVAGKSSWISSVTASSSTTTRNAPVFVQVLVNTEGLAIGAYHDSILVSAGGGLVQPSVASIPVSLFVASSGPILAVDTTGVLFQAVEGGGSTETQIVKVLDLGDSGSTVNWNATLVSGSDWLKLVSSSGTATSAIPGNLTLELTPGATELTAGPHYAVVKITDSKSLNSPEYVTAVLNLEPSGTAAAPELTPVGLFFTTPVGGPAPAAQQVQVNTSSASAVSFNAAVTTADGATWLTVAPTSGTASGQTPGSLAVSVDPTGLPAGIYSGDVNVSIGALLQSVNVTFVVQPSGSSSSIRSGSRIKPQAAGCSASSLAITETGLANNFAVPAGWPATLIVQLNNDCAAPVNNGNVVASFSNGDAPLSLAGDTLGNYSATWQPGSVNANMVVTLNATAGTLQPATAKLYGGIAPNQTPPPTVAPGGTLNNLNPVVGAGLAPGTIAQVYGTGLAPATVSTGAAPLPTTFNNTFALVGPAQAPLYFLSSGQINIQIPNEATATQQLPIVLSVNNALTLPQMLDIVLTAPGVLSADDGANPPNVQNGAHIIAQHSADFSLVSSSNPAKPGEYLIMYLVGLGATNPSVASGAATPASPLHPVTVQPIVTVGSQPSTVAFAGLSPFFVGLYQINFQVPSGLSSGELEVDVTQNGVAANPTKLPVSN
jgi:uncharacterized protein (TIGR03437 family)